MLGAEDEYRNWEGECVGLPYFGKTKAILNLVDRCEKQGNAPDTFLYTADGIDRLWEEFQGLFKNIQAAGGLVYNDSRELLFIYRRGFWDLPKGKADAGETIEETALREVQEETGLAAELSHFIHTSLHTYRNRKKKRVLKHTHWYRMSTKTTDLVLQHEEDIEKAIWVNLEEDETPSPIYRSLLDPIRLTSIK